MWVLQFIPNPASAIFCSCVTFHPQIPIAPGSTEAFRLTLIASPNCHRPYCGKPTTLPGQQSFLERPAKLLPEIAPTNQKRGYQIIDGVLEMACLTARSYSEDLAVRSF